MGGHLGDKAALPVSSWGCRRDEEGEKGLRSAVVLVLGKGRKGMPGPYFPGEELFWASDDGRGPQVFPSLATEHTPHETQAAARPCLYVCRCRP